MFAKLRAERLHSEGMRRSDEGDEDGALALYFKALELQPDRSNTLYNIGLIYKYRQDWPKSLEFNQRASSLRPDDEATRWNLAIAATALGDWRTARNVWAECGFELDEGDGPILANFGETPVRLNPEGGAEVVWARRIDPVRARIQSIPFPQSGFFYGDIVLHDGAATGERIAHGRSHPVFNVFERLHRSGFVTVTATLVSPSEADLERLSETCDAARTAIEDWTANIRWLCRQCSEGLPHDEHDGELPDPTWMLEREFGFATTDVSKLKTILVDWAKAPGRDVRDIAVFE